MLAGSPARNSGTIDRNSTVFAAGHVGARITAPGHDFTTRSRRQPAAPPRTEALHSAFRFCGSEKSRTPFVEPHYPGWQVAPNLKLRGQHDVIGNAILDAEEPQTPSSATRTRGGPRPNEGGAVGCAVLLGRSAP